jgi:GNAT superfamily N-acetyltransferase
MEIQRLRRGEGERLRALRLRALRDAPDAFSGTFEEAASRPLSSWGQQLIELPTFVAVLASDDVGMARGGPYQGRPGAAILLSMWVAPEARGRGVGEALLDAVVAWARAEGFARLLLDVADTNTPAVSLYARKGFRPTGATGALPPPREHILEHEMALELCAPGDAL